MERLNMMERLKKIRKQLACVLAFVLVVTTIPLWNLYEAGHKV